MIKTTNQHRRYWEQRKIDWSQAYGSTVDHPHRDLLLHILSKYSFASLFELGCGSAPNLVRVTKQWPGLNVGGVDISEDAISEARRVLPRAVLDVREAHNVFMSDKSNDVLITDACLIYYGPRMINKAIKEIKRLTRKHVVLCEFHSESFVKRQALRAAGYNAYNYVKLLEKHGFYDVTAIKIPKEAWPGTPWEQFGYFIVANL